MYVGVSLHKVFCDYVMALRLGFSIEFLIACSDSLLALWNHFFFPAGLPS